MAATRPLRLQLIQARRELDLQLLRARAWINAELNDLEPLLKCLENPISLDGFEQHPDWNNYHLIVHLRNSINAVNRLEREVLAADVAARGDVRKLRG